MRQIVLYRENYKEIPAKENFCLLVETYAEAYCLTVSQIGDTLRPFSMLWKIDAPLCHK